MTTAPFSGKNFAYIIIPVLIGMIIAIFFTFWGMGGFKMNVQPTWMPPSWVFGVVWTIIYGITIVSYYFIYNQICFNENATTTNIQHNQSKLFLCGCYLSIVLNAMWCFAFFGSKGSEIGARLGVVIILALILNLVYIIYTGWNVVKWASAILFVYIAWLIVALFLNCSYIIVNKKISPYSSPLKSEVLDSSVDIVTLQNEKQLLEMSKRATQII